MCTADDAHATGAAFDGAAFDGAAFDGAAFDGAAFDGAAFEVPASTVRRTRCGRPAPRSITSTPPLSPAWTRLPAAGC